MCIVINDKSQGSIAKHLRIDELLNYAFIIQSAGDRIFKTGEVTGKWWLFHAPRSHCIFSSKMLVSADKLNTLCITDRNSY